MSMPSSPAQVGRYLVRSRGETRVLRDFLNHLDPQVRLIQTIGPEGDPHTAVLDMPANTAQALRAQLEAEGSLILEPDQPLSMFR